jgi:hypothetical protein
MSEQEEERKSQKFVKYFLREVVCSMGLCCSWLEKLESRVRKALSNPPKTIHAQKIEDKQFKV